MADTLSNIHKIEHSAYRRHDSIIIERTVLDKSFPLHWHDHYELIYFTSGSGTHHRNGTVSPYSAGTLHFIVPTDFHSLEVDEPSGIIKLIFGDSDLDHEVCGLLASILPVADIHFDVDDMAFFERSFELCALQAERFADSEQYCQISRRMLGSLLIALAAYLKDHGLCDDTSSGRCDEVSRALSFLHMNFRRPVTLAETADYVHFSPSYLSKRFSETVGVNFKEYLTSLRLKFAVKLLCASDIPVTEVCFESGFGSLSNFIYAFKTEYGVSPTEYRRDNSR